jgi:5-dehydro-2-deoxygluconokinase
MEPFDLITMGRVGVDLYPLQSGVSLEEVASFGKYLGGTATNVAVAAARLGRRSAVVTKVGDDPFGRYVRSALTGFGVDPSMVSTHPTLKTPVVFCEIFPPDRFPLYFYREPKAPDLELTPADLDMEAISRARIFWTTGTGLSAEPSRSTTLGALRHRGRSRHTIHDLDWRPMFWSDPSQAGELQREALSRATVAVGNLEECAVAVGEGSPEQMGARLLELGLELAVVKMGPNGVRAFSSGGSVAMPPVAVEVVNGLGAGDAFGGALCHGLLAGWSIEQTLAFANAAGAYVAGQLACADAMPSEEQVRELMAHA